MDLKDYCELDEMNERPPFNSFLKKYGFHTIR